MTLQVREETRDNLINGASSHGYALGKKGNSPTSYYTPKSIPDGLNTKMFKTKLYKCKRKYRTVSFQSWERDRFLSFFLSFFFF